MNVAELAAKGAEWLDKEIPDWYMKIQEELDMSSCSACVLGQLFETYQKAMERLGIIDAEAFSLGFNISSLDQITNPFPFTSLTRAWGHEIKMRRNQSGHSQK